LARRLADRPPVGAELFDLLVGERLHPLLPLHGRFEVRRECLHLLALTIVLVLFERRHHAGGEELERLADVLVAILAALLDEHDLVDAHVGERLEVCTQLVGRADAAAADVGHLSARRLVHLPDVGAAGLVRVEDVVVPEREAEELKAVEPATARFLLALVTRKAGHHCDVGIDRVADRHALVLERRVVVVDPMPGLGGVDEREGERAQTVPRGGVDYLAARARHPHRGMRLLHRFW
jgi:hypothetical protein